MCNRYLAPHVRDVVVRRSVPSESCWVVKVDGNEAAIVQLLYANHLVRLVLADTDELHKTISEMSKRIRQLEDALQIEHGMRSVESHPLLREELLSVKKGLERHKSGINEEVDSLEDEREDIQNAMGLLTISEGGGARYLGITGSEQALLAVRDIMSNLCS